MSQRVRQAHPWLAFAIVLSSLIATLALAQNEPVWGSSQPQVWLKQFWLTPLGLILLALAGRSILPFAARSGCRRLASEQE